MTEAEIRASIAGSPEGLAFAQNQEPSAERAAYVRPACNKVDGTTAIAVQQQKPTYAHRTQSR